MHTNRKKISQIRFDNINRSKLFGNIRELRFKPFQFISAALIPTLRQASVSVQRTSKVQVPDKWGVYPISDLIRRINFVAHLKPFTREMVDRTTIFLPCTVKHLDRGKRGIGIWMENNLQFLVDWAVTDIRFGAAEREGIVSYNAHFAFTVNDSESRGNLFGFQYYALAPPRKGSSFRPNSVNYAALKKTPIGLFNILMYDDGVAMGVSHQPAIITEEEPSLWMKPWMRRELEIERLRFYSCTSLREVFETDVEEQSNLLDEIPLEEVLD